MRVITAYLLLLETCNVSILLNAGEGVNRHSDRELGSDSSKVEQRHLWLNINWSPINYVSSVKCSVNFMEGHL